MGNYLPKRLEECSTDDLVYALQRMGPSYAIYSKPLQEHGVSGAGLVQFRVSSQYEELFDSLKIQNQLHRIVLMAKLKIGRLSEDEDSSSNNNNDDDCPEVLANFLKNMGPDYLRYIPAIRDNCLSMDVLGKLKLEQWKIAFEGIGVHDILEQNILYNKIMDHHADNMRAKKRKSQQESPAPDDTTHSATLTTANKAIKTKQSANTYSPSPSTRRSARALATSPETIRT